MFCISTQDSFPQSLPHGCKPPPPPLSMQHPCSTSQKPRTMATVPPLHQVIPQPSLSSYDGNSLAFSSSRTSSFAAALRKLAKQAGDPVTGDKDVLQVSPVSSPALSQGSLTPKRTVPSQPPMFLSTHTGAYPSASPPVVTIAPSRPHASLSTENRKLQVMDLSNLPQGSGSATTNGHLVEPLSLKLDATKSVPRPGPTEKWDDHSLSNKVIPPTSGPSQVRPHATIAPLPRPDDSLTSSRGFQPYRGADDVRASLPHHITSFDHHHSAYPYSPAFLPHPHLSHPAYRFEESLYLDRYSLLRPPLMTFPPQTSIMAPPSSFYPNSRYDLLAQSLSLSSASNNILNHDRMKREEEQRQRKKETDFDQSRNREHEREHSRDKDQKEKDPREHKERETKSEKEKREKSSREKDERLGYVEHKKPSNTLQYATPKKPESPSAKSDPTSHFTVNRSPPLPPPPVTSVPLNLVVHQNNEQHKRETELWLPWQQQPTSHSKKQNNEEGFGSKNSVGVNHQDNHIQNESTAQGKDCVACPTPCVTEMKIPSSSSEMKNDVEPSKKYVFDSKKFDMLHQHITELSNKEHPANDWKHEKGQKTSISNHRKNSCSEPKKVKDESLQNHMCNNHSRKPVNGIIVKPSPYLDEGMHTRLLETEKCRIEFNGQISNKNLSQSQQIEKLPVPVLKPIHVQTNRTDIISPLHKMFTESQLQVTESPTVVSKLDKEFEALQKAVVKDGDESSDSEDEKIKLKNFLFLTKGPSLPMDMDPEKMKFLHVVGLTSHLKRKKLELESYLKRRKLLHEDDEEAPCSDEEEKSEEISKSSEEKFSELYTLSESLRTDASPEKLEFAFTLGLNLISPGKKEESKRLRKSIEEERIRRENRILNKIKGKATSRHVPKIVPSLFSPLSVETELFSSQLIEPPLFSPDKSVETALFSPKSVKTGVSAEAFMNPQQKTHGLEFASESRCTGFSKRKLMMFSHRKGHNLKNQWKQSTFQSDPLKKHLSTTDDPSKVKTSSVSCKSVSTQVEESSICGCTVDNNNSTASKNFIWPGLETVMEAYIRHQTEQSFEKEVLSDQYCRLRLRQAELKSEADNVNKSLAELMEMKKKLEEEGQQYQRSLDNLKQLIEVSKKLTASEISTRKESAFKDKDLV